MIGNLLEPTAAQLHDCGWQIIHFARKALITTDSPVALIRDPSSDPQLGVGIATAAAVLTPLDRRVALLMTDLGEPDRGLLGTTAWARDLNQRLAWDARRAIFHHPDDNPLDGLKLPDPRQRELVTGDPSDFLLPDGLRRGNSAPIE